MKFIGLWSLKASADQKTIAEAMGQRADFEFPKGIKLLAEYWSSKGSPVVVSVFEADDAGALMINTVAWADFFNVDIFPVVTFEEGLESLGEFLTGE